MSKTAKRIVTIIAAVILLLAVIGWGGWRIVRYVVESRSPIIDDPKTEAVTGAGFAGYWEGTLNVVGLQELRIQVHIEKGADGKLTGTMISPDQLPTPFPMTEASETTTTAQFEVATIRGHFKGDFNVDGSRLTGHWTQGGMPIPLLLKRQSGPPKSPPRPQTPQAPFPYAEHEVTFQNGDVKLAGTLIVPSATDRPVSAVVLICGSGPQDRDETIFGHKPFWVIADSLARSGIAVLRYDKRGVGKSTGSYATATHEDFAADAESAFAFLKTQPGIDPKRIGLCGHSEGSTEAFIVASRNADVAFVISLAGVGVSMDKCLERQRADIFAASGKTQNTKTEQLTQEATETVRMQGDTPQARSNVEKIFDKMGLPPTTAQAQLKQMFSPWMIAILRYDPVPTLKKVQCPVLALNGDKDTQVAADVNLPALRAGLEAGGNNNITTKAMPGLNHLFQKCKTGSPLEYAKIEETFSPDALATLSEWLTVQTH